MKIVLAAPPWAILGMDQAMRSPPLGLLYLAGAVPEHDVTIFDLKTTPKTPQQLEPYLKGADLFGMTIMTSSLEYAQAYLEKAQELGCTTVVGGYHPTLIPEIIEKPFIDIVVRGEGEITFKELCDGVPLKDILGISYKDKTTGAIVHNEPRPLIKDIDELPMPRKDLLDMSKYQYLYQNADVIESTRGCPFKCTFCSITTFYGNTYRMKSAERLIRELEQVDRSKRVIFFVDDNFAQSMPRVGEICDLIAERGLDRYRYAAQARVDSICKHPEIIAKMARAGFICLFLGIESIHEKSLTKMGKKTTPDQITRAIEILHENGILAYGSFIVGNIGETREDTLETVEFMRKSRLDLMQATPLTPYPGTPLYQEAIEKGWLAGNEHWWEDWDLTPVMNTPDLTREEIKDLLELTMRRFYYNIRWTMDIRKWKMILGEKFLWWWQIAPKFYAKGAVNFIFKLGN